MPPDQLKNRNEAPTNSTQIVTETPLCAVRSHICVCVRKCVCSSLCVDVRGDKGVRFDSECLDC